MRYELTNFEWAAIKPMLPNKPRGVSRVKDPRAQRHLLDLAFGRAMARSAGNYGPRTTCYDRFLRWRQAGVWDRIMDARATPVITRRCR